MFTGSYSADLLLLAIVALICLHSAKLWHQGRFLVFDPLNMFWAGIGIVYVLQPMTYGRDLMTSYEPSILGLSLLWCLIGLCSVICGYESRMGVHAGRLIPSMPPSLSPNAFFCLTVALVGVGALGVIVRILNAGGLEAWTAVGRGAAVDFRQTPWYVNVLTNLDLVLPYGVIAILFHVQLHRVSPLKKSVVWGIAWVTLLWLLYLGTRSRTTVFVFGMLAAVYAPQRRNPPLRVLIPLVLAMIVVIPFLAAYRHQFTGLSFNLDRINWEEAQQRVLPGWLTGSDDTLPKRVSRGTEISCVMASVDLVPDTVGYNYGYCLLEFATRPIPRYFWPEKRYPHYEAFTPICEKRDLSRTWDYRGAEPYLAGPAFTFVGHWWAVGGPVAVILAGFCTGMMLRALRNVWDRMPGNEGDTILIVVLAPIGFFEAASTPLFFIIFQAMPILLVMLVLRWSAGGLGHRNSAQAIMPREPAGTWSGGGL